jgi:hypothetical protein
MRRSWPRFLAFNASGGITYGLAYYYLGNVVKHARAPLDIVLAAMPVIVVIGFLL